MTKLSQGLITKEQVKFSMVYVIGESVSVEYFEDQKELIGFCEAMDLDVNKCVVVGHYFDPIFLKSKVSFK
jgi:hypothetical protein